MTNLNGNCYCFSIESFQHSDPANDICAKYMKSWITVKSSLFHLQNDFTVSEYSLIF